MRDERRALGAALLGAALLGSASPSGPARAQAPSPIGPPAIGPIGPAAAATDIPPPYLPGASSAMAPPPPFVPAEAAAVAPPAFVPADAAFAEPAGKGPIDGFGAIHTPGPAPGRVIHSGPAHVHRPGPIGRAIHHVGFTIKDRMIGEHERFIEPPLGWSVGRNFAAQRARADLHRYTLYRSDFLAGTDRLTPEGLRRLGRMVATWHCYPGPMLVEVDPNHPGLAEARRLAVIELAASHGAALDPDRLIVGGSPYLGGRGDLSEIYDGVLIDRSLRAPQTYPLNPIPNADFSN